MRDFVKVLPYSVQFTDYWVSFRVDTLEFEVHEYKIVNDIGHIRLKFCLLKRFEIKDGFGEGLGEEGLEDALEVVQRVREGVDPGV